MASKGSKPVFPSKICKKKQLRGCDQPQRSTVFFMNPLEQFVSCSGVRWLAASSLQVELYFTAAAYSTPYAIFLGFSLLLC